jgi:hypothetical protein
MSPDMECGEGHVSVNGGSSHADPSALILKNIDFNSKTFTPVLPLFLPTNAIHGINIRMFIVQISSLHYVPSFPRWPGPLCLSESAVAIMILVKKPKGSS